jgi:hypothetical protein
MKLLPTELATRYAQLGHFKIVHVLLGVQSINCALGNARTQSGFYLLPHHTIRHPIGIAHSQLSCCRRSHIFSVFSTSSLSPII